jgi:hypothetical protein
MASKKPIKLKDSFDLDGDLEDFDFDSFEDFDVKDDRKPAIKIKDGFKEGFKDAFKDSDYIKKTIKKTLPPGYGEAMDFGDDISRKLKDVYDDSVKEIRPAMKEAKRAASRLIPSDSKYLPKYVRELLDGWKEEEKLESTPGNYNRESAMASVMQDTFAAQAKQQHEQHQQQQAQDSLHQGMQEVRFKTMLEAVGSAATSLSKLDQYQGTIDYKFKQRSLELQYRSLFVLQDMLKFSADDSQRRDNILLAIAKNTSLPEFVKIKDSEARSQVYKTKMFEALYGGLYGKRNRYIEEMIGNIRNKAIESAKGLADGVREGISTAEMVGGMSDIISPEHMLGSEAGGWTARTIGNKSARYIRNKMGKSKLGNSLDKRFQIRDRGIGLQRMIGSMPNHLNEFRKNSKYGWDSSIKGSILSAIQGFMPSMAPDARATILRAADMDKPFFFTRRTDKSINEVIPGFLARILREMQVMRTGDNSISLIKYDYNRHGFATSEKIKAGIMSRVVDSNRQQGMERHFDYIFKSIDPDNKLGEKERKALREKFLENSASVNLGNAKNLASPNAYRDLDSGTRNNIVAHMDSFFKNSSQSQKKEFEYLHNEVASQMGDPRQFIQEQIDLGNLEDIVRLGLIDPKTGEINLPKIRKLFLEFKKKDDKQQSARNGQAVSSDFVGPIRQRGKVNWKKELKEGIASGMTKATQIFTEAKNEVVNGNVKQNLKESLAAGLTKASGMLDTARNEIKKRAQDVYVFGQKYPKLRKAMMDAGVYRTKFSNKVVKTLEDITEPIVDEQGNTIVDTDELAKLVIFNTRDKTVVKLEEVNTKLKSAASATAQTLQKEGTVSASIIGSVKDGIKKASDAFKKETSAETVDENEPSDVHVEGEKYPRLTAVRMKMGYYINMFSRKKVEKPSDIEEPVVDIQTNQVVVGQEDLAKLVMFKNAIGMLSPLNIAKKFAKGVWWLMKKWQFKLAPALTKGMLKASWSLIFKPGLKLLGWGGKTTIKLGAKIALSALPVQDLRTSSGRLAILGMAMKAGEYVSDKSGKIITQFKDIDGTLRSRITKQVVVTYEELKAGLMTADGQKVDFEHITQQGAKAFGSVKDFIGGKFTKMKNAYDNYGRDVMTDEEKEAEAKKKAEKTSDNKSKNLTLEKFQEKLKGNIGRLKKQFGLSRAELEQMETNTLLRKLVTAAIPKGFRKNSYEQLSAEERAAEKEKSDKRSSLQNEKGYTFAKLLGIDKLGKMFGKKKEGEEAEGGSGGGIWDTIKTGGVGAGAAWLMGKFKGKAAAAGAEEGVKQLSKWGLRRLAVGTALRMGIGAVASVAGEMLLGGVLAALGLLSTPVVLGAGAIALAGYGVYKGYKYLTKGDISPLTKLRLVQYGYSTSAKEQYTNALDLESQIKQHVFYQDNGLALLKVDKLNLKDMMSLFGLDYRKDEQRSLFGIWFRKRFQPIYLTHLTALRALGYKNGLDDVDTLSKEHVNVYFNAVKFPDGPYDISMLPYLDKDKAKATNEQDVANAAAVVQNKMETAQTKSNSMAALIPVAAAKASVFDNRKIDQWEKEQKDMKNGKLSSQVLAGSVGAVGAKAAYSPDAETEVRSAGAGPAGGGSVNAGNLKMAPGPLSDGRNAESFIKLKPNVTLEGLNPQLKKQFYGAVEEYARLTGRGITINSGFRSYAEQERQYKLNPGNAAKPGSSMHEFGLAIDADPNALNEMDRIGLLRKYGLTRPVGGEPWHLEAIGVQDNIGKYKQDPQAAEAAIEAGLGKGGGGNGTMSGVPKLSRSADLSKKIMESSVTPVATNDRTDAKTETKKGAIDSMYGGMGFKQREKAPVTLSTKVTPQAYGMMAAQNAAANAANRKTVMGSPDAEFKPSNSTPLRNIQNDPTMKVPDAKSTGFDGMRDTVTAASRLVGVDENLMLATMAMESDGNAGAAADTSSAKGPLQFTDGTWKEVVKKYGAPYGITETNSSPNDPKASAIMAAHYFKDNIKGLSSVTGGKVGIVEAYFTHLLGLGGARRFFREMQSNPQGIAAASMPEAASRNKGLFYSSGRALTFAEVYQLVASRMAEKARRYGINAGISAAAPVAAMGTANAITPIVPQSARRVDVSQTNPTVAAQSKAFTPSVPSSVGVSDARQTARTPVGNDSVLLKSTESLLSKSLSVQTDMLKAIGEIRDVVVKQGPSMMQKASDQAAPQKQTLSQTPPRPSVSMARTIYEG